MPPYVAAFPNIFNIANKGQLKVNKTMFSYFFRAFFQIHDFGTLWGNGFACFIPSNVLVYTQELSQASFGGGLCRETMTAP